MGLFSERNFHGLYLWVKLICRVDALVEKRVTSLVTFGEFLINHFTRFGRFLVHFYGTCFTHSCLILHTHSLAFLILMWRPF